MALSGNLREFALSEILQLLSSQRKTGSLRLTRGAESQVVYLLEGRIAAVRDRGFGADDPFVRFLRRIHRLSEEQLRGIASIHAESGRDLEDLLLNGRYLEREEMVALYERLVLTVLNELLGWEDGTYSFSPVSPPESPLTVSFGTEAMLMESVRRLDEYRRYTAKLKDPGLVLGMKELPDPDTELSEEEKELFGLVDGRHTLGDLVAEASLTDYEAYEALYKLIEAGWIEISGRRAPTQSVPEVAAKSAEPRTWKVEFAMAGACLVLVAMANLAAWRTTNPALLVPAGFEEDVFARLGMKDVRLALDLYRHQHGSYPASLEDLVGDGWLKRAQLSPDGYPLIYRRLPNGNAYDLEVGRER